MPRMQFNLRQLLLAIIGAAVALLLIRFAFRSYGVAVGLSVFVLGGVVLVLINFVVYAFLRGVGAVYGLEPDRPERVEQSKSSSTSENSARS